MTNTTLRFCVIDGLTFVLPEQQEEASLFLREQHRESAKVYVVPYATAEEAEENGWDGQQETGTKVYAAAPEGWKK